MLIPPDEAEHFLRVYKAAIAKAARQAMAAWHCRVAGDIGSEVG